MKTEEEHGDVQHEEARRTEGKAHDGTGTKCRVEAVGPSRLLRRDGRTDITKDRHLHSEVTGSHTRNSTEQETERRKDATRRVPASTPGNQHQNDKGKDNNKPKADSVLGLEERFGTFVDGIVNLVEAFRLLGVVAARVERFALAAGSLRLDGDALNDMELGISPEKADNAGEEDDS